MKTISEDGTIVYRNEADELHRDGDKPAIIWADGTKHWYKNGKRHRDGDRPAVIHSNGFKGWHKNGKLHRDRDEPAEIWSDGTKLWYKNGKSHREAGPAIIDSNGSTEYYLNDIEYNYKGWLKKVKGKCIGEILK